VGASSPTPTIMELIHVRTPPASLPPTIDVSGGDQGRRYLGDGFQQHDPSMAVATLQNLAEVTKTGYQIGLLVASQSPANALEHDLLLCMAPDLPRIANLSSETPAPTQQTSMYGTGIPQKPLLSELMSVLSLPGKIWAVSAVPASALSLTSQESLGWNELARQSSEPPAQMLVLTNEELNIIARRRPVDSLRELIDLARRGGSESHQLTDFFDRYVAFGLCCVWT
jgi:nuclear pore complex protein Nup155